MADAPSSYAAERAIPPHPRVRRYHRHLPAPVLGSLHRHEISVKSERDRQFSATVTRSISPGLDFQEFYSVCQPIAVPVIRLIQPIPPGVMPGVISVRTDIRVMHLLAGADTSD